MRGRNSKMDENAEKQNVQTQTVDEPVKSKPIKSKTAAGVLFILFGDIGIGNFYMGKIGLGILDIVFCWTAIPGIINLIRGIIILCGSKEKFAQKYNVIAE